MWPAGLRIRLTFLCHPLHGDNCLIMAILCDEGPHRLPPDNVQHCFPLLQSVGYHHSRIALHCCHCRL